MLPTAAGVAAGDCVGVVAAMTRADVEKGVLAEWWLLRPEAMRLPSGEKATEYTAALWPAKR